MSKSTCKGSPEFGLPEIGKLIIARGSHKGRPFVYVGIIRMEGDRMRFVSTDGAKCPWSCVSRWDYLQDVAPEYDIWA